MADIIRLLPDAIANQIAAGEVVQRPASVVKELMENAVDAGATQINVIIKDAGKSLIQVTDNGKGMSQTDARLCFERHATSKIREAKDLFSIRTMGFRGEAMASIAAVAQVEMKTRQESAEVGVRIEMEGSECTAHEACACPIGTNTSVKNLFFNVPARRNFLKSNPVEMRHILDEFQRVALAYPEIGFSLFQNDMETYRLLPGKLSQRITGLFGNTYREQLVPCKEETSLVTVSGYVGTPLSAKKTRGEQFFFVNNRYIKNGYLHHAVINAFENLIPADTHPFYVLNLEIDPVHIDINVHPTKTEIKFDDERAVYAVIQAAVRQALGKYNIAPSLDFDADVNFDKMMRGAPSVSLPDRTPMPQGTVSTPPRHFLRTDREEHNVQHWEKLFEGSKVGRAFAITETESEPEQLTFSSAVNSFSQPTKENTVEQDALMLVHGLYLLAQVKSGLMLVHREWAMERILYEQYLEAMDLGKGVSQQLLFPERIELNPADFALVESMRGEIRALGFDFEVFGQNSLQISGMPADILEGSASEIFEGLLEQYKSFKASLSLNKSENLARSLAKRAAKRHGKMMMPQEMRALIDRLFACKNPNFNPDGKRTFVLLDMNRLLGLLN